MKRILATIAALIITAPALAQADKPGAILAEAAETVVVVRTVNYEARTITVARPDGKLLTLDVPPESQNLDQIHAGSRFRVAFLESVAIFISPNGGEPAAGEGTAMKLAAKGDTPGGVLVDVKQIQARVDAINYATRRVALTGPEGNQVEVTVDEAVERLDEVNVGDIVVVRYTQALAMRMIRQ